MFGLCQSALVRMRVGSSPGNAATDARAMSHELGVRRCGRCVRPARVGIEAHRDAAQEELSGWSGCNPSVFDSDQSVGDMRPQLLERVAEIGHKVDFVTLLYDSDLDAALAHQLTDHRPTHAIIPTELKSTPDRQGPVVKRRFPGLQLAKVLAEAVADMTDGTDAQADQVAVGMGRIAHEVALQLTGVLGAHQIIIWQRKVIHADVAIAAR